MPIIAWPVVVASLHPDPGKQGAELGMSNHLGFHTLGSAFFKTKRHSLAVDFPQEVRVLLGIVLDQEPPRGIRIVARCPVSGRPWDTLGRRQFPSQFQSDARRCVLRINVRLLSGGRERPIDRIRMTVSKQFEV